MPYIQIKKIFHIILLVSVTLVFIMQVACFAENIDVEKAMQTSSINENEDMVLIPLPFSDEKIADSILEKVTKLRNWPLGVQAVLYKTPGQKPTIILNGTSAAVKSAVAVIKPFIDVLGKRKMAVVTVDLRQLNISDIEELGLNVVNPEKGLIFHAARTFDYTNKYSGKGVTDSEKRNIKNNWDIGFNRSGTTYFDYNALALQDAWDTGRTLVAGKLYTNNGQEANLISETNYPFVIVNQFNGVSTTYQQITTNITVKPIAIDYNEEHPEESLVKLSVIARVSFVTNIKRFKGYSLPEYTTKDLRTVRVVKADNQFNFAGSFASDIYFNSDVGVPLLKDIPFFKYFFSKSRMQKERVVAALALAVTVMPEEE